MTIKLLNSLEFANKGKIIKRFFIVYKKYNYLGEVFYCVKNSRNLKKHDGRNVLYLEKKTGRRVFFDETKILSDKQFKNRIRILVASTQKAGGNPAEINRGRKMTDKEREELAEAIGKGLASGSKISAEDLQNENTISYKMGEIMEMDADFVTLLNFVDWYSPTKEVNEKLTKMLRHIAGQTYQNQTKVADLEKENTELKKQLEMRNKVCNDNLDYSHHIEGQLTKAKDHIKKLLVCLKQDPNDPQTNYYVCQYMDKAEQFLNSEVEK